jgi:hypothetical protein
LPEVLPGNGRSKEFLDEGSRRWTDALRSLYPDPWLPCGVRGEFFRIVRGVRLALSGAYPGVGLDQLTLEVTADQGAVDADVENLPDVAIGERVESTVDADVLIRMDLALLPDWRVVATF